MFSLINCTNALSLQTVAAAPTAAHADTNIELVVGIFLFGFAGFAIAFGGLFLGWLTRPKTPHPEKAAAYECGEPAIGDSWVQFDLRFYTVALVFLVFDVEIALLWPWAVVFKDMGAPAFWAFFVFFLLIAVPFMYEWKSGYLTWVRSSSAQEQPVVLRRPPEAPVPAAAAGRDGRGTGDAGIGSLEPCTVGEGV